MKKDTHVLESDVKAKPRGEGRKIRCKKNNGTTTHSRLKSRSASQAVQMALQGPRRHRPIVQHLLDTHQLLSHRMARQAPNDRACGRPGILGSGGGEGAWSVQKSEDADG